MIEQRLHIRKKFAVKVEQYCLAHDVKMLDHVIEGWSGVCGNVEDVMKVVNYVEYLEQERREEIKNRWSLLRYIKRTHTALKKVRNKTAVTNFRMITGHMYIANNQNGFNNALYDYFQATDTGDTNAYSKKQVREMVQNIPPYYPVGIVIIDQTFECGRLYLEFFNPNGLNI